MRTISEIYSEIERCNYIIEKTKNPKCKKDHYKYQKRLLEELKNAKSNM